MVNSSEYETKNWVFINEISYIDRATRLVVWGSERKLDRTEMRRFDPPAPACEISAASGRQPLPEQGVEARARVCILSFQ